MRGEILFSIIAIWIGLVFLAITVNYRIAKLEDIHGLRSPAEVLLGVEREKQE